MSIQNTPTSSRTVSVSSDPATTVLSPGQYIDGYRTMSVSSAPVQYGIGNGYDTVRYLMPVQQAIPQQQMQYVLVNQPPQVMQQMVSPVYLQNIQRVRVNSLEESDIYREQIVENVNGKTPSVFSQMSSPIKSPEPSVEEEEEEVEEVKEEMVNIVKEQVVKRVIESVSQVGIQSEMREVEPVVKMDTRFFGELLAEVYRKNCDIHTCISEHVAKIRGRKHLLDPSNDYKVEREDIEALIPKGASELTKQQLRYLLQTRMTADKTMRLLLTTFSSLREELIHMTEDLRRLESEKESLERDLSFKADQAEQYDRLLEALRENNRQLQISLKETSSSQRTLETQLMSSHTTDSNRDFRIKELEGSYRALEKENEMLKQKLAGQYSSSTIQMNTEELSRQYSEQLAALRQEKDKELQSLRTQLMRITTEYTTERSGDKSLQLRITQLLTTLEQREVVIKRQEEEIWRLQQEKRDSSKNVTTTTITKRYRNQYPLLGLLTDDYNSTSPVKDTKTIVIESRTGEMIKQG
ncbi:protein POF1B isoform X3 [Salmo trutta]|uniref:protein POF1B isoform X3 n=1 Tax=Salmo trutta TaxID=8032 RepID=UPI001130D2C0|nr:protein POF1B-like isoform X3 [Salmo trutta]